MINEEHRTYLTQHAITGETIERFNIRSEENEIVFPWTDGDLVTEQRRPWPGNSGQYYWEKDKDLHFWDLRDAGPTSPILLVEGTKQALATVSHAPAEFSVLGMAGCEGWNKCDLSRFEGRTIYMALDADAGSNLSVYEAGHLFKEQTEFYRAEVRYLWLPARGSSGMDDVLAKIPEQKRGEYVGYLAGKAQPKPAEKRPTTRKGAKLETILPDTGDRVGVAINIDRKEVIDKITGALKDKLDGTELFNYGDVITRLKGHETVPLDKDRFLAQLADTVACFHYTEATNTRPAVFDPRWPDPQTVGAVMSKADEFSELKRVVRVPFLRPDGTVCITPGYDRETATVLVLGGLEVEDVPSDPTQEETRAAAKFLMEEWLGDFPFPTDADRANALALILTPFIRGLVPLVPLAVVNGLEMGVGKNLLVDCAHILTTGDAAMPLPFVGHDEEMRKQITAAFSSGAEVFAFDEAHVIEGAQLARAMTSLTYGDRILGVSRIAKFPNTVTWIAMGNQVQVNKDMSRRVYFVALRPVGTTLADRDARQYRHQDIKDWTTENRPRLVAAALTVLRGWYAAGRPRFTRGASMGSFEPWDRMMSGVLAYAGYPAFLTDMKERRSESDFEGAYWSAHIHWLRATFGASEFTTKQVQEQALRSPGGFEPPPEMDDPSGKSYTRMLGMAYARHVNRLYDGLYLHKSGLGHRSTIKWCIRTNEGGGMEVTEVGPTPPAHRNNVLPSPTCDVSRKDSGQESSLRSLPPSADEFESAEVPEQNGTNVDTESCAVVGFDLETASAAELWTGGHSGPFVRLGGVITDSGSVTEAHDQTPSDPFRPLLDTLDQAEVIYGHNILGYDIPALARHNGADYDALAAKAVDLLPLARLLDPPMARDTGSTEKYDLNNLAQRLGHTGKSDDLKALADEHGGYDQIPVNDKRYVSYLHGDLSATEYVYEKLIEQMVDKGLTGYAQREMRVVAIQNRMTLNGWKVDTALLAERVAEEDEKRREAADSLHTDFGMPLAPPDKIKLKLKREWPDQAYSIEQARALVQAYPDVAVKEGFAVRVPQEPYKAPWNTDTGKAAIIAAFEAAGAGSYPKTASGEIAINKDALGSGTWYDKAAGVSKPGMLRAYPPEQYPQVARIVEMVKLATGATAKYAEVARYLTPDGRVHAEVGAAQASGRWATSKPAGSNFGKHGEKGQQRAIYVADDGHVLVTCDQSQVDMRAVAGLCQDPAYMALFGFDENGDPRDAHMDMAEVFFGERTKEARRKTKAINHKVNYGGSAKSTAEMNGLEFDLVQRALDARAEAYPRLIEWTNEVRALGESGVLLDNGFGRPMRCDPRRAHTQAPALMGQGAARDLMCKGLLRLVTARPDVTPYLRGVIHDEVILSVPENEAAEWQGELKQAFTFEWRDVPILCDVSDPARDWASCYLGE